MILLEPGDMAFTIYHLPFTIYHLLHCLSEIALLSYASRAMNRMAF